jgi:hypothetical protein
VPSSAIVAVIALPTLPTEAQSESDATPATTPTPTSPRTCPQDGAFEVGAPMDGALNGVRR